MGDARPRRCPGGGGTIDAIIRHRPDPGRGSHGRRGIEAVRPGGGSRPRGRRGHSRNRAATTALRPPCCDHCATQAAPTAPGTDAPFSAKPPPPGRGLACAGRKGRVHATGHGRAKATGALGCGGCDDADDPCDFGRGGFGPGSGAGCGGSAIGAWGEAARGGFFCDVVRAVHRGGAAVGGASAKVRGAGAQVRRGVGEGRPRAVPERPLAARRPLV